MVCVRRRLVMMGGDDVLSAAGGRLNSVEVLETLVRAAMV